MQATVEASNCGSEFCDIKAGVEMVYALRYKLLIFRVTIDGYTNMFCDNEAVYNNTITSESVLKKSTILLPDIGTGRQWLLITPGYLYNLFEKIMT